MNQQNNFVLHGRDTIAYANDMQWGIASFVGNFFVDIKIANEIVYTGFRHEASKLKSRSSNLLQDITNTAANMK